MGEGEWVLSMKLDRLIAGSILRSKLVFLIIVQPHAASIEGARLSDSVQADRHAEYILPSVWTLIMRAIKCLKGVWWMPWR